MRDVLAVAGASGDTVTASALDDFTSQIPTAAFRDYDIILALEMNGGPLLDGFDPIWIVGPLDQHPELAGEAYKEYWIWALARLDVR